MKHAPINEIYPAPGFQSEQLRKLHRPLDQRHVNVREVEGRQLSYIEGWYAISKANEIFGYAGWDRDTVHIERVLESAKGETVTCGYTARVRVRVRAGSREISREGTGCGFGTAPTQAAAYERAIKSAETDATKRALSTFGPQFGLHLYDNASATKARETRFVMFGPDGRIFASNLSAQALLGGLRQLVEKAEQPAEINALMLWNNAPLVALRSAAPELQNADGAHFVDLLLRLAERCIRRIAAKQLKSESEAPVADIGSPVSNVVALGEQSTDTASSEKVVPGHPGDEKADTLAEPANPAVTTVDATSRIGSGDRIEKSVLRIGHERRLRSKAHLKGVAELPCTICNRQPSHAHHIKYAQRRGLSQKVSDEFVVPLCAMHHGDLHRASSEQAWWAKQGQDPLEIAAGLWDRFRRNLNG